MNLTPFLTKLRERLAADDLAAGTVERTLIDAAQFEEWYRGTTGEDVDPDNIKLVAVDLAEYRSWLQRRRMKPSTIARKFASIRKTLMLLDPDLVGRLRFPKLPAVVITAPSGFTRLERNAILRACEELSARDNAIVKLALYTGARASSLATARLSGLQLNSRSGSITYLGKGNKTYSCPLNLEAREALAGWLRERPEVGHDFIFAGEKSPHEPVGRWLVHDCIHRRLTRFLPTDLAERMKGSHMMRHDLGRRLLSGDEGRKPVVPLADVAAILAHSDPRITASVYCRPSEADLQRALDRLVNDDSEV